ncbi:AmpG family muropeptide MFS transporter [Robbsia sp. Bb-Pol-6]|uniref:AmpG family muropeptide MFS transporter n=1 Tax=Robbsia betulipollinis TaxID=2981849 RepID=A0ABT3ZKF5_9BURK|nr:AmpG family muropeptide MFS transporter [Robbsia betulipollinis]MCY0386902.1 AmpG family muropeptide MFS transporter [Robbsia betulipollinis]
MQIPPQITPPQAPVTGWRALFNTRMLICVFLGFTSGLPLFVLINLVQAWMRSDGVNLKQIGLFTLIQFPYTWKFVWAPLLDRFVPSLPALLRRGRRRPPGFAPDADADTDAPASRRRFGRRRSWMLLTQVLVTGSIAAMGFFSPRQEIWTVAGLAVAVAFFSASSDVVIDAYRRELLTDREQGLGTAIHVNAYKIAGLVPGSLALILADHLPWSTVFMITAAFMLPGIVMTLVVDEPVVRGAPPRTLRDAVVLPFREFVERGGWRNALLILAFIFLYKLGDSMATALATSFYLDLGFTKTQIGLVAKASSLWASVAGGILGGLWLVRLGISRGLWVFGVAQIVSTLGFAWLAAQGPGATPFALGTVIALEAFGAGLGTAAFTAYIASTTDERYTATQFALFTSLASVPRTVANAGTGYIVVQTGWFHFFVLCAVLAVPGMLLLPKVAPWRNAR